MAKRSVPRTDAPKAAPTKGTGVRWYLLIHQIPPKPDYLRVKIGRRLQQVGAVAIKNSVYALPARAEAYEDLQWIMREIVAGGGDAFVSEATLGDGLTDEAVRARFDSARNAAYRDILAEAKRLAKSKPVAGDATRARQVATLRRRFEVASAIDFFGASDRVAVAALLHDMEQRLRQSVAVAPSGRAHRIAAGTTWVTRRDVHVDRIACAWLIRRFIDRRPKFRFVDASHYAHRKGEVRFDMFEAEYTHIGEHCSFETLASTFVPEDPALREISEVVHDVDCKDALFRRDEAPGLARLIAGIATRYPKDVARVERGSALFDDLYAAFGGIAPSR